MDDNRAILQIFFHVFVFEDLFGYTYALYTMYFCVCIPIQVVLTHFSRVLCKLFFILARI